MVEPTSLPPGIYFDLGNAYHNDKALSRSNLVDLLDTPHTFWKNSWMNPKRKPRPPSKEMEYGKAFDTLLFEPNIFETKYQIVPIDAWAPEKEKVTADLYFKMVESIKVLRRGKDSKRFLSAGMPHVVIVFDYEGYRFRCEHDWFMVFSSTDFKTIHALEDYAIKPHFKQYGYDIQLALYKKSRERFKEQYRAGEADVYGDVDPVFFKQFIDSELNEFIFIFQRKTEPYPFRPLFPEDDTEESGLIRISDALKIYTANLKQYGTKIPWPVCEGRIEPFSMFYGTR